MAHARAVPCDSHGRPARLAQDQLAGDDLSLTAPRSLSIGLPNVEAGPELGECSSRQALREDVRVLRGCRDVKYMNFPERNLAPHKMNVNLNVFRASMLHWISGQVHSRDIITIHHHGLGNRLMELLQQLA